MDFRPLNQECEVLKLASGDLKFGCPTKCLRQSITFKQKLKLSPDRSSGVQR